MSMRALAVGASAMLAACATIGREHASTDRWPRIGDAIEARVRLEVSDLYARYALYADAPAGEAYATLFADAGEIVMGDLHITGHEALARRIDGKRQRTIHLQGSPVLVQVSPTRMVARTPVILGTQPLPQTATAASSIPATFSFSVYQDELVATSRGWRFLRRTAAASAALSPEFLPRP